MSDTPQGPGWWLASDGKYYPPEQASPPLAPPPVPPPLPQQPAKSGGGKGCMYALIAVAALVVLGVIGAILAVAFLGGAAVDKIEEAATEKDCAFLSDAQASDVLGGNVKVVESSGFNQLLGIAADTRVLEDAPSCYVTTDDSTVVARVARYEGSDASSVFTTEKDVADGTSQDQGGGLSLETDAYLSGQEVTAGDEGFCTTSSLLGSAGVLVRKGDTLVYVSIQPDIASSGTVPDLDLEGGGFASDSGNCTTAQELANKILG